jgi:hypothetical protein
VLVNDERIDGLEAGEDTSPTHPSSRVKTNQGWGKVHGKRGFSWGEINENRGEID